MAAIKNKKAVLGRLSLLLTTIIWGTSFVILKNTLGSISTLYTMAFRFTIGTAALLLLSIRSLKDLDKQYIKSGILLGFMLFGGYAFQTYGLVYTTPGKNAFLTSTYCIIVPFLYWAIYKRKPNKYNLIAAFMSIIGIGLVSLNESFSIGLGEGLTITCGLFYALHIIFTSNAVENRNPILITMLTLAVCCVLSWISALIVDPFPTYIPADTVWSILYLAIMCTGLTFILQVYGQKYTPPSQVSIILGLESVFGTLISIFFYNEVLTLRLTIGFTVIFLAVLISETKLGFLKRHKKAEIKKTFE